MKPQSPALIREGATPLRLFWLTTLSMVLILSQSLMSHARGAPESFADLAESISPSVVNITTSTLVAGRTGPQGIVPDGSPFEEFFREFQDRQAPGQGQRRAAVRPLGLDL